MSADEIEEYAARFRAVHADLILITGSAPAGIPEGFWSDLLNERKEPVVLDIRGAALQSALKHRPLLVKPNREELGHTLGRSMATNTDVLEGMGELRRLGAQWAAVTDAARRLWVAGPYGVMTLRPPRIKAINPIGSGDSFAAAFAAAVQRGEDVPDALRQGCAAGAANAEAMLPARIDAGRVAVLAASLQWETA
jgi:fructose-1-phosphate kinase PfkB-like protein